MAIIKPNNNTISAITALPQQLFLLVRFCKLHLLILLEMLVHQVAAFQKAGTNFEVSLTPSSTSSKILVQMAGGNAYINDNREMHVQMYRKIGSGSLTAMTANDVDSQSASIGYVMRAIEYGGTMQLPHSFNYLDTPSTTSAVTYAPYFKSTSGNAVYFNTTDLFIGWLV